jgi:hypothetical protein
VDPLDDTVGLFDGRMSLSEAKLVSGDETGRRPVGGYSLRIVFRRLRIRQGGVGGRMLIHEEVCRVLDGELSGQLSIELESNRGSRQH